MSSAKLHIDEQKMDILVKDRNLLGLVANWRVFLHGANSEGEKDLRRDTKTGRPSVGETRTEAAGFHEITDVSRMALV